MLALVLEGAGLEGARIRDWPDPRPKPGEVVVELRAAALNHRDLWACRGWGQGERPAVLGSDGAGDRAFPFAEATAAFRHLDPGGQFGKVVLAFKA